MDSRKRARERSSSSESSRWMSSCSSSSPKRRGRNLTGGVPLPPEGSGVGSPAVWLVRFGARDGLGGSCRMGIGDKLYLRWTARNRHGAKKIRPLLRSEEHTSEL